MSLKPVGEIVAEAFPQLANVRQVMLDSREALLSLKERAPDLSETIDAKVAVLDAQIAALDAIVDQLDIKRLAIIVVSELADIPRVGLTGHSHPHTATGG